MAAVLGIDLGTSSAKALLLCASGEVLSKGSASYPTLTPREGWIEQDPEAWWQAVAEAVRGCLAGCRVPVEGIGFSGHMSALVPLDDSLNPLRPAITIADTRCAEETRWLSERYGEAIAAATGNVALSAFTLPKLLWYRKHEPESFARTRAIVGAKDYLRLRATGTLGTEPTEAGNTLLLDIMRRRWNVALVDELELPSESFPPLDESLDVVGELTEEAAEHLGLAPGLPVIAGMADMAASALGTGLLQPERLAITLGTSGQITQAVEAFSPALIGRFTYHPHALPGKLYVMASLFTGGLGLQWLAEVLASLTSETQDSSIERVLRSAQASPPGARGVLFLPHLTGSGSPHFDASRAASFLGLKRHHTGSDLCRAVLEGVGFSVQACLDELLAHCPAPAEVVVGGGGMRNSLWRRIVCDITGRRLAVLREHDAGPLGTALAVSAGTSLCADLTEQIQLAVRIEEITIPVPEHHATYREAYRQYLKAVDA